MSTALSPELVAGWDSMSWSSAEASAAEATVLGATLRNEELVAQRVMSRSECL